MQPGIAGQFRQLVQVQFKLIAGEKLPLAGQEEQVTSPLDVAQTQGDISGQAFWFVCFRQGFNQACQRCHTLLHIPVQLLEQRSVRLHGHQALFDFAFFPQQSVGCLQTVLHILDLPFQPVDPGEILLPYRHAASDWNGV